MIAACDTFRAGAVEQLRTHTCKLNMIHSVDNGGRPMVKLFDKGYDKDAASVAMSAITMGKCLRRTAKSDSRELYNFPRFWKKLHIG